MTPESYLKFALTEEREQELFKDALIFFDTSALLDFYYFSEDSREEVFSKLFKILKDRLWIGSQTEYEFLKNREKVLLKPIDTYRSLISKTKGQDGGHLQLIDETLNAVSESIKTDIRGQFKTFKEKTTKSDKHPFLTGLDFDSIESDLQILLDSLNRFNSKYTNFKIDIQTKIDSQIATLENNASKDDILEVFKKTFKTTPALTFEEILKIVSEGELRYKNQIPPGYLDEKDKIGFQKYGDLILWKQVLQKSNADKKDIILVINDLKEDWWLFDDKKRIAPRHELIQEFISFTECNFWMYDINSFLFNSKKYIDLNIEENIIEEIKNVTSKKHFSDQNSFCDWLLKYFSPNEIILCDGVDYGIDYILCENQTENIGIIHKQLRNSIYTKLLFPIKSAFDHCTKIKSENNLRELILIIEYPNYELASSYLDHLKKKLLKQIMENSKNHLHILIVTSHDDSLEVLFDSED